MSRKTIYPDYSGCDIRGGTAAGDCGGEGELMFLSPGQTSDKTLRVLEDGV